MSAATHLALLVLALTQAPAAPPSNSIYQDPALHFTFTYPANLKPEDAGSQALDALRKQATTDGAKQAVGCGSVPLTAIDPGKTTALLIVGLDLDCLKLPVSPAVLGPVAKNSLMQGLARMGKPTLGPTSTYKLDGHDAAFVTGAISGDDAPQKKYGGATCMLMEKHVVCLAAIAPDKAGVTALLSGQLTFEGHDAQPLVPAELLAN